MSNDLYQPDGGQVAPYSPGGDLQPYSPAEDWGNTPVDYLDDRFERGFGQLDPQIEANVAAIADVFMTDMTGLGYVQRDIDKCISFFKQMLVNPPTKMPAKKHAYPMWQFSHDIQFQAFCNYAATQRFPPELIQSVAYWLQQLEDFQHGVGRFAGQQVQGPTSADPLDALNDSDYARVQQINAQAAARTDGILRDKWGTSYAGNMRAVQEHWNKLSTAEQQHLEQLTAGWIKGTNTVDVLLGLYKQAIGAGSIPKDSVAIAREIASYENIMKTERSKWMKDDAMQARYRHLLTLRDGGR